nr:hypothetical protein [Tanacetum cinerariifolium]
QRDVEKERSLSQQALQQKLRQGALAGLHKGPDLDRCTEDQPIIQSSRHPEWFSPQQKPPSSDCAWYKTVSAVHRSTQPWISELAKQADTRINQLKVDTLTPELLVGPTYELMKGSCKSLVELEYHLEEVFKATTDQLDWVNPEGQQYPHNLLKLLPLIPNNRGRHVIPFEHFINNDLENLRGDASSRYEKHALWEVSHWGRKRHQFYGFAVNQESARDVYSKRRIIAVTKLKIVASPGFGLAWPSSCSPGFGPAWPSS